MQKKRDTNPLKIYNFCFRRIESWQYQETVIQPRGRIQNALTTLKKPCIWSLVPIAITQSVLMQFALPADHTVDVQSSAKRL
jgi:hypothetical protein